MTLHRATLTRLAMVDWYELVEGWELLQGDILSAVPILRLPRDVPWPVSDGAEVPFEWVTNDAVIVTQSCDLVEGQKADMWLVALCPVWTLDEAALGSPYLATSRVKEQCRRGNLPGYHMIAEETDGPVHREASVVSFREIWSLPLDFLRAFATECGPRLRIRSPYREHLAQAFARYFMRVGLPTDIPRFEISKGEEKAFNALSALDPSTRSRVVRAASAID